MVPSLQWRDENRRVPLASGEDVRVGSGRNAAAGYLASSQRAGPGLVILAPRLDDDVRAFVDRCRDEGFTALAPDLSGDDAEGVGREATEMLVANWHPRVGVLAVEGAEAVAAALDDSARLDAVVVPVSGVPERQGGPPRLEVQVTTAAGLAEAFDFLSYHLS